MTSEDLKNRKWTEEEKAAVRRIAASQAAGDDSGINFEDIPRFTPHQLAQMVRLRDLKRKVPVSVMEAERRAGNHPHDRHRGR